MLLPLHAVYSQRTSREALTLTVTFNPFSAEHQYFPESFLFTSKLSVSPLATVFPSLVHVIFGVGFPMALQWNVAVAPSMMVWSIGSVVSVGETADNRLVI